MLAHRWRLAILIHGLVVLLIITRSNTIHLYSWSVAPVALSIPIHLGVVILILAIDDFFPPGLVFEIPLYCFLDAIFKLGLRQPTQLLVDFRRIDGVMLIMAFTVGHINDEGFGFSEFVEDSLHHINVGSFVVATDVVDFTDPTVPNDEINRFTMVFHVEPITDVKTRAVDRQRLVTGTRPVPLRGL